MDDHELAVAATVAVSRAYGWLYPQRPDLLTTAAEELVDAVRRLGGDYPEEWPDARATLERLAALR